MRKTAVQAAVDSAQIAHLLRRAGFGGTNEEIARYTALGYDGAVDALLNNDSADDIADPVDAIPDFDPNRLPSLQTLWLYRMVNTRRPLHEKMALFWHGHFATANAKVNDPQYMWGQYGLFRSNALGSFRLLVQQVAKDPAMMRWLDTVTSKKAIPNENFARELLELFTLGIGNYTETDIKEAARAFTGWEIRDNVFYFNRNQFDSTPKTFLGKTGSFTGEDIIDLAVDHPETARFITTKLYRFFVDDHPKPETIDRIASIFTSSGLDLKSLMRAILLSPEFTGPDAYHAKVKSPVEFVVGAVKTFGIPVTLQLPGVLNALGQSLFNPPTVKGWTDGPDWISASTLLTRANFANQILTGRDAAKQPFIQPSQLVADLQLTEPGDIVDYFLSWLANGDASAAFRSELVRYLQTGDRRPGRKGWDGKLRAVLHLIMASPIYQFN
jgi:uncharacterized protein (DUF1800 family)